MPPDAARLYRERAEFDVEGLGIDEMTAQDFDAAAERIALAARALGERGAHAVALLGTSLSFFRGAAFNDALERSMRDAARCPAVTATSAVVGALRAHGAKRVAVGTAYDEDMNARLAGYLDSAGFEVAALAGMNIRKVREAMAVADDAIVQLAERAWTQRADALLLSCGAFATGHLLAPLAARLGAPVVSTTPAALAAAYDHVRTAPTRA